MNSPVRVHLGGGSGLVNGAPAQGVHDLQLPHCASSRAPCVKFSAWIVWGGVLETRAGAGGAGMVLQRVLAQTLAPRARLMGHDSCCKHTYSADAFFISTWTK